MPYYSHCTIMGHLGRDVESTFTPGGKELHKFSVAVSEKRGAEKETSWFNVTVWGEMPTWKRDQLKKGALCMVAGRIGIRSYTAKDGGKGTDVSITADPFGGVNVFGKADDDGGGVVSQPRPKAAQAAISDDDVPF
jgi:single-strand DNA-binding protein